MKHAFLIMAHTNWRLLKRLLKRLDFSDSYIYLNIDAKAEISEQEIADIKKVCKCAAIKTILRKEITWGGYSQIECELALLKAAVQDANNYYHYMSGNDYLLVSEKEFKEFFCENRGKEFIGFSRKGFAAQERQRYQVYHFFQEKVGRDKSALYWLQKALVKLQMYSRVDRTKKFAGIEYEMGSNWCSITDYFAKYLLSKEQMIREMFRCGFCCDEAFVQTVFVNSPFVNNNFQRASCIGEENTQNVRAIDWKRGKPYTYEYADYEELMKSGNIFVRKVNNDTPERERLLDILDKTEG